MSQSDDKRQVTRIFRNSQSNLFEKSLEETVSGPIACLGQTFENDAARREHFLNLLAEKLQDPAFRKTPGFPKGTDEAILRLSDPPYYTACPNPWLPGIIELWSKERRDSKSNNSPDSPYIHDVREGKQHSIYNAHSYHTKVPYRAVMRYVLHYTKPGEVVLDSFAGTGMTGVACQMCASKVEVEALGYKVDENKVVYEASPGTNGVTEWVAFSKLGERRAVLSDLSPLAAFISHNLNAPFDQTRFWNKTESVLAEIDAKCRPLYQTLVDGQKCDINFVIWSDVLLCGECGGEIVFWESAIDLDEGKVRDSFICPSCGAETTKRAAKRAMTTTYDRAIDSTVRQPKRVPVAINYSKPDSSARYEKVPDEDDIRIINDIEEKGKLDWYPTDEIPPGDKTGEPRGLGITNVHHFYTARNLFALSVARSHLASVREGFLFSAILGGASVLNQLHLKNYVFGGGGCNPGPRKGVIYCPSISLETPVIALLRNRLRTQRRAFESFPNRVENSVVVSVGSAEDVADASSNEGQVDYVFIDPPFGSNLMYSELSHTTESWLGVLTNNEPEAIENRSQGKGGAEYREIMTKSFARAFHLLKPGGWATVEFSNTSASVWSNIQHSLGAAGFVIGHVAVLDKKQGGLNAIVGNASVKQDLVISAYKPAAEILDEFDLAQVGEEAVWAFVREHLRHLPVFIGKSEASHIIAERTDQYLYDRLLGYFVQRSVGVPIDRPVFLLGLSQRFPERDGMYFLPEQVAEYDRKRTTVSELRQLSLFVTDEASATQWIRQQLHDKPQSFQDLQPQFMKQLQSWAKHEKTIDLKEILEFNFICFEGDGPVPSQIHSYLSTNFKDLRNLDKEDPRLKAKAVDRWYVPDPNKEADLERLRIRTLLKEYEEYRASTSRRIKQFRTEAVRAGFKQCYDEGDYQTIVDVAAKLPEQVIQEDEKLLMYHDVATMRLGL